MEACQNTKVSWRIGLAHQHAPYYEPFILGDHYHFRAKFHLLYIESVELTVLTVNLTLLLAHNNYN